MKKGIWVIVLLLAVTGLFYAFSGKGSQSASLSVNDGVRCVQTAKGDAGSSVTTMYIYKDIVRYDSSINHEDAGAQQMHALIKDGKTYVWGSAFAGSFGGENMGFVFDNEQEGEEFGMVPSDLAESIEKIKTSKSIPGMECEPWSPEEDLLNPPADIQFKTQEEFLNSMMQQGMQMPVPQQ